MGGVTNMGDEEVSYSWEDVAESGTMERRLEEKLRITQKHRVSGGSSGTPPLRTTAIMIQDGSLPRAPPPQIRILKRPSSNGSLGSPAGPVRPLPQVKPLAQREAEYAEARRRILGSAGPRDTPKSRSAADSRLVQKSAPLSPANSQGNGHAVRQSSGSGGTQGIRLRR